MADIENHVPLNLGGFTLFVSTLGLQQSISLLVDKLEKNEGAWIFTLNWEMVSRAVMSKRYGELISQADWIVPDGMPIVLWTRWTQGRKGQTKSAQRLTGVELTGAILQLLIARGTWKIAIIGGNELERKMAVLEIPPEMIGFLWDGPVDPNDEKKLQEWIASCRENAVRILFLCLGVPKQDELARRFKQAMPHLVILTVGGSFNYLTNAMTRAPQWMQEAGFEWFWRLCREPRRLAKRYLLVYPLGLVILLFRRLFI